MRDEVLSPNPAAPLKLYVVWFNVLPGDSRARLDTKILSDPRVTNYWDEQKIVGRWFSDHVTNRRGITWDAFFLFGPDAQWQSEPGPLISAGGTIIAARDRLAGGLHQLGVGTQAAAPAPVLG